MLHCTVIHQLAYKHHVIGSLVSCSSLLLYSTLLFFSSVAAQVGSTFCHGGKLTSIGLLRTGVRLGGNTCTYTVGAARVAWAGLNTIAGGLSVAGVAIDIVSVPLDSIVLIKGAYDIHKYRTGKGSNSKASKQIKKTIDQLTEGRQKLMDVQEAIGLLCSH